MDKLKYNNKDKIAIEFITCNKCGFPLDIKENFENNKGVGVVYTCPCGHKTGVMNPKD